MTIKYVSDRRTLKANAEFGKAYYRDDGDVCCAGDYLCDKCQAAGGKSRMRTNSSQLKVNPRPRTNSRIDVSPIVDDILAQIDIKAMVKDALKISAPAKRPTPSAVSNSDDEAIVAMSAFSGVIAGASFHREQSRRKRASDVYCAQLKAVTAKPAPSSDPVVQAMSANAGIVALLQGKRNARGSDNDARQIIADLISDDRSPFMPDDMSALHSMTPETLKTLRDKYLGGE